MKDRQCSSRLRIHKDPNKLDLTKPRLASDKQEKWKKTSGHGVLGRCTAFSTNRIEVLSNTIERNHPLRHVPAHCISEVVVTQSGEITFEKVFVLPQHPPTISFKDEIQPKLRVDAY